LCYFADEVSEFVNRDRLMASLKFNFNKPKPVTNPQISSSKPAFGDSDDEDLSTAPKLKKQPAAIVGLNEDLRTYTSLSEETSSRMAKEALEVDPSGLTHASANDSI
jgi:hypothetical protein